MSGKFFNYPQDVEKPLYGIDQIPKDCKSIIICESCINALTCVVYGFNAVALLGTGTPYQINQLKSLGVQEYVLCLDGDDGGRRGAARLKRALKSSGIVWIIDMPDGKDVNDVTKNEFLELYQKRM